MTKTPRTKAARGGINKSQHSLNPDRTKGDGGHNMRDRTTIRRLNMYRNFKAKRDQRGKIVIPAPYQSRLPCGSVARVEPNRRWFGNTRVVTQTALQSFQEAMGKVKNDPYKVVMSQTKLPITLLNEVAKHSRMHLLDTESFENTFGKKSHRKKPNLAVTDVQALIERVSSSVEKYDESKDSNIELEDTGIRDEEPEIVFKAGQSKRIWNELYKVIDSSDVVVEVLDARDPLGTRCYQVEKYIGKEKSHKHIIFILNKVDLVPVWVTQKWVAILSAEHPTMAFHASITNPFGKGALINLLRQFGKLHLDKKQISVGFIGYPNVGKSSIINTLRAKKVCKVAPIAGETKVWQYITLMKRIFLVDCPGIVYPTGATQTDTVLKGVVRVENIRSPEDYIGAVLERAKKEYVQKTYNINDWSSPEDFLEQLARKSGRLLKKGEPDLSTVAKMVLNDWQRGKIPYFVKPPGPENEPSEEEKKNKEETSLTTHTNLASENSKMEEKTNTEETSLTTHTNLASENSKMEEKTNTEETSLTTHTNPASENSKVGDLTSVDTKEKTSVSSDKDSCIRPRVDRENRVKPRVKQNLRDIHVEPVFEADDVREIPQEEEDGEGEEDKGDDDGDVQSEDDEEDKNTDSDVDDLDDDCEDADDGGEWEDTDDQKPDKKKHFNSKSVAASSQQVKCVKTKSNRDTRVSLDQSIKSQSQGEERGTDRSRTKLEGERRSNKSQNHPTGKNSTKPQAERESSKSSVIDDGSLKRKKKPKMRVKNLKTLRTTQKKISFKPKKQTGGTPSSGMKQTADVKETPSGKWSVTPLPSTRSRSRSRSGSVQGNIAKLQKTDEQGCFYEVQETDSVMFVDVIPAGSSIGTKSRKRAGSEDEQVKITGKQRRKMEREARDRKIGVHFYSKANVKNRSYR
ncbi:nucleolar GTP-binding protein 2-like [Gigantopelta aegis]|uniref:nucleolar GTP-binding protein 2-like n=1 Tax=Gigantopelta aegis TaxID=1735272 RepID=UPI001B88C9B8|nr:nucleolar GTP-binding protein 2-like [Gigantopelta aegis]